MGIDGCAEQVSATAGEAKLGRQEFVYDRLRLRQRPPNPLAHAANRVEPPLRATMTVVSIVLAILFMRLMLASTQFSPQILVDLRLMRALDSCAR